MEAPEKIYVALDKIDESECTFVLDHRIDYPICTEYIRTDAFIKNVEKWLYEHILDYVCVKDWGQGIYVKGELFDDFRNYIKGK